MRVAAPDLRIVSEALWLAAQARLDEARASTCGTPTAGCGAAHARTTRST